MNIVVKIASGSFTAAMSVEFDDSATVLDVLRESLALVDIDPRQVTAWSISNDEPEPA